MAKILLFKEFYGEGKGMRSIEDEILSQQHSVELVKDDLTMEQALTADFLVVNLDPQGPNLISAEDPGLDFVERNLQTIRDSGIPWIATDTFWFNADLGKEIRELGAADYLYLEVKGNPQEGSSVVTNSDALLALASQYARNQEGKVSPASEVAAKQADQDSKPVVLFFAPEFIRASGSVGSGKPREEEFLSGLCNVQRIENLPSGDVLRNADALVINVDHATWGGGVLLGRDFFYKNQKAIQGAGVPVIVTTNVRSLSRMEAKQFEEAGVAACVGLSVLQPTHLDNPYIGGGEDLSAAVSKHARSANRNDPKGQPAKRITAENV